MVDDLTDEEIRDLENPALDRPAIHFPQLDTMDEFEDLEVGYGENTEVDVAVEREEIRSILHEQIQRADYLTNVNVGVSCRYWKKKSVPSARKIVSAPFPNSLPWLSNSKMLTLRF